MFGNLKKFCIFFVVKKCWIEENCRLACMGHNRDLQIRGEFSFPGP